MRLSGLQSSLFSQVTREEIGVLVEGCLYEQAQSLCKQMPVLVHKIGIPKSLYVGMRRPYLLNILGRVFIKFPFGKALQYVNALMLSTENILRDLNPRVVILHDTRTILGAVLGYVCKKLSIPTITLQWSLVLSQTLSQKMFDDVAKANHQSRSSLIFFDKIYAKLFPKAVYSTEGKLYWAFNSFGSTLALYLSGCLASDTVWAFGSGNTDIVVVWGKAWASFVLKDGVQNKDVLPIGLPVHDDWVLQRLNQQRNRDRILSALGVSDYSQKKIVSFVSSCLSSKGKDKLRGGSKSQKYIIELYKNILLQLVEEHDDVICLFRPHPRDSKDWIQKTFANWGSDKIVCLDAFQTDQVIAGSDLVLCQWSTVAMMAGAMGVPVICLNFYQDALGLFYQDMGAFRQANSIKSLHFHLAETLRLKKQIIDAQDQKLSAYISLDGKATDRFHDLINRIGR